MTATRGPRIVLAVGVLVGLANAWAFPTGHPEQVGLATDAYYHAARAALSGADFYAVRPPGRPTVGFRYQPAVVLAFYPHALLGGATLAYAFQTALNLIASAALAVLLVRFVEDSGVDLERTDRLLVAGYALASSTVVANVVMGQVNAQLALALAAGVALSERGRSVPGGVAFGAAAAVKLFPALLGAWLVRRRDWRAVAAATATGLALLLTGLVAFGPGATETYVFEVVPGENAVGSFPDGPDPSAPHVTVRRQLTVLAPWLPSDWLLAAGAAVLAPVVVGVNRVVSDRRSRLVAYQGTLLATLVLFPLEPFYLVLTVFPTVPLLYLLDPGTPRRLFLAGALVLSVPVTYDGALAAIATTGLPAAAESAFETVARATFAFALPSMWGVWLVLAACLLYQHRAASARDGAAA